MIEPTKDDDVLRICLDQFVSPKFAYISPYGTASAAVRGGMTNRTRRADSPHGTDATLVREA
jgi:hypothetical protein